MEQKNLIAMGKDLLLAQVPLDQQFLELQLRKALPEKIFLTRKFNPTFCTCGKHCSHEPQYHMERTVFRLNQLSGPTSAGDLELTIKEKLKTANFIIESTEIEGEDEAELFHNKKIEFVKELMARLKEEDVHRIQDYFGKEGRITLTGFDSVLLCQQRKSPSKAKSIKEIKQKATARKEVSTAVLKQTYQDKETAVWRINETGQKANRKQIDIDRHKKTKRASLFEKTNFNKEIADIVQAYETEYKESKENDEESVAKPVAEETHDKTTAIFIDPYEVYQEDFESEPNYILLDFDDGDDTEDNKSAPILSHVESSCPLDDGRQVAQMNIFKEASGVTERIIPIVEDSTSFHSNDIYTEIADIVRVYEAEVVEAKEIDKRMFSGTLDTAHTGDDDWEFEATLKHAFVVNAMKIANSVSREAAVDTNCSVDRLDKIRKEQEGSDTDTSMYEHLVSHRRQDFEEGLKKFSESVVSTILEHISESDKMTDKSLYEHTALERRHDLDEGLEKFSESVVSTIVEQIKQRDRMKTTQESRTCLSEIANGTKIAEKNTRASNGLMSDSTLAVVRNVETTDTEIYDEEGSWVALNIEREELKAADSYVITNVSDSNETDIALSAPGTSENNDEAGVTGILHQAESATAEVTEENSNDELIEDLRHFTLEVPPNTLPVIACYDDDDDNGLSPWFGILSVYCESEIHASWGGTDQGSMQAV